MKNITLLTLAITLFLLGCSKQAPVVTPRPSPVLPPAPPAILSLLGSWRNDGYYKNLSVRFAPDTMYLWGYVYSYYISSDTVFSPPNPLWKFRILGTNSITLLPISSIPSPRTPDTFYRVN